MENKPIFENWREETWTESKVALLDGLQGTVKTITEQCLDQARLQNIFAEAATPGATASTNIADFRNILLPMIRRTLPNQIAHNLVGVQPMRGPVGLVYSMRFRHRNAQAADGVRLASPLHDVADGDEMFSPTKLASHYSGNPDGTGEPTTALEAVIGNQVDLQIVKQPIEAKTRKMSSRWTIESTQDANSQHGVIIENELISAMSAEIIAEMDQEVILDLANLAGTVDAYDQTLVTGAPVFVGDKHAALGSLIAKVSGEIARLTKRGGANWMVASQAVIAALQSANRHADFRGSFMSLDQSGMISGGHAEASQMVGVLNGGIKVYHDTYNIAGSDTIVLGYKGPSETDAGYFHCPYIPLLASPVVTDPNTMEQVIQLMTRYGKAIFVDTATSLGNSANYYGKITVSNLSYI